MTNYITRAGVDSYLLYGTETTFGTQASTIASMLGIIQSFDAKPKRNLVRVRGVQGVLPAANTELTGRDTQQVLRGKFEGTMSISFQPQTFDWLVNVLGTVSGTGTGADPFNYPQETASTVSDKRLYLSVPSITISTNYYYGGAGTHANKAWNFLGGKVNTCTISANIGEPVSVSFDVPYANMVASTSLTTAVALAADDVFHFTGCSLEWPTATPVTNVFETFSLSINNSVEMIHGLGTDVAQAAKEKAREFSLDVTFTNEGSQFTDIFMGSSTTLQAPTVTNSITLKLTAGTDRNVNIVLLNSYIDADDNANTYPDVIKQKLTLIPKLVYVTEQTTA